MQAFLQGMGVGAGLIMAIGAQNVFVLSQGIRKQYHWLIAMICSLSDVLLIFIGAAGVGTLVAGNHVLQAGAVLSFSLFHRILTTIKYGYRLIFAGLIYQCRIIRLR